MIRRVFIAVALSALMATLGFAQRGGGGEMGGGGGRGGGMGGFGRGPQVDKADTLTDLLKLKPEQKADVVAIMDAAQKQADPLVAQIVAGKRAMLEAAAQGNDLAPLAQKLASLNAQVLSIEADAFAQTLSKLDAKQKSKGPQLFEDMAGMFLAQGGWHRSR
ncbi:MAG TPA: hypothetical protein VMU19_15945 [Bryobacteraceae bacterium]|nr:hypothetical protein [Bryobacteraceae bacterium]